MLEALALAEPPPEVHDSLNPDHEWMLSTAKAQLESFRVSIHSFSWLLVQDQSLCREDMLKRVVKTKGFK